MVNLSYNPIDGIEIDKIIADVYTHNPTKITIFNELEWELRQITPEFIQFLKVICSIKLSKTRRY